MSTVDQILNAKMVDYLESAIKSGNFNKCFGTVQGAMEAGMVQEYGVSEDEANRLCDAVFNVYLDEKFPGTIKS